MFGFFCAILIRYHGGSPELRLQCQQRLCKHIRNQNILHNHHVAIFSKHQGESPELRLLCQQLLCKHLGIKTILHKHQDLNVAIRNKYHAGSSELRLQCQQHLCMHTCIQTTLSSPCFMLFLCRHWPQGCERCSCGCAREYVFVGSSVRPLRELPRGALVDVLLGVCFCRHQPGNCGRSLSG